MCGVGGPRACANATNHPPGQCRRLKHDLNGQLVWGERTQRLSGTSRVTAMCENCQKVTVEDTPASTMPKPVTTGVKRSHHFKGFKKRAARTTDATAAHADGAEEMEMTEAEAAEEQAAATAFSGALRAY